MRKTWNISECINSVKARNDLSLFALAALAGGHVSGYTFLISKPDLFLEQRPSNTNSRPGFISREPRTLVQLQDLKRTLQKEAHRPGATPEARVEWRACIKAIQHLK